jgi:N-acetylmuramic acid 6-phosphate etherase
MTTTTDPAITPLPRTEQRNPRSTALDSMSSLEVLTLLNSEDATVAEAVAAQLPQLARLVDAAADSLDSGGTVHYFGAGTSGRLAVLDAAELVPTFNLDPTIVVAHMAGGAEAIVRSIENSEDSEEAGAEATGVLVAGDIAIGLTASGSTPFVRGALRAARERGAITALISANLGSVLAPEADILIEVDTGPEALTGSTRLKAGTAEKFLLNGFSTALMVRKGRTWSNLMVSMVASNAKLRERAVRILAEATGIDDDVARSTLRDTDGDLKVAIVSTICDTDAATAAQALDDANESVRDAIRLLTP